MSRLRIRSIHEPFGDREAAVEAAFLLVEAEAMGLLREEATPIERLDEDAVRRVAARARDAGIGETAARPLLISEWGSDLTGVLRALREAMEESPVPRSEWPAVQEVLGSELLARLLGVSETSVKRYAVGSRATPDEVAERLHFLARLTGYLAGAYNDVGIRRWFHRKRSALGRRSPANVLRPGWVPDAAGPRRVLALARDLVYASAT
jgi:hypothetical protein